MSVCCCDPSFLLSFFQTVPSPENEATDSNELNDESKEEEKIVKEQLQMSIADVKSVMETMATAALLSFQVSQVILGQQQWQNVHLLFSRSG